MSKPPKVDACIRSNENSVSVDALPEEQRRALARWLRRAWLEARFGSAIRWKEADE